ncbi:protein-glutamate methylesterase/protein-glutamine glutaminase [Butyrivibrio sp. MC2013]|uniref:protein-glutamate methylesterase/protein-glutamine glutaminase n=1 Tax=Butyrivibrio sp. MC2013 TaxID=1280686 RepID=UPI0003FF546C|nr:chemotaxis response regulator protein-glutamate methylesterase [Butyrivibrio sp. MC2013]
MKKIFLVDDSALMRSVLSDIINSDSRFHVEATARDGIEALNILKENNIFDVMVLDVNMPKMNGIELLKEINKEGIRIRVMMASTDTLEGAKVTMDALDLGAIDFVHKPDRASACKSADFSDEFLSTLGSVSISKIPNVINKTPKFADIKKDKQILKVIEKHASNVTGNRIVAIASSTGGPRALQSVIPKLPKNLKAPVVLVQHMPVGFTASLAQRLDSLSEIAVKEAEDGEEIKDGTVYIARGGIHMYVEKNASGKSIIRFKDGPNREGVKPSANNMYESLANCPYDQVVCVVLTGMGADGTEGIKNLKGSKKVHVISQDEASCTVYGMPRAVAVAGLSDQVVTLEDIAQEIVMNVGVR